MAKVTITEIGSTLTNSAAAAINENFSRVQDAIENTLSRDGTAPNNMTADLDMDSNDILNVDVVETANLVLDGQVVALADLATLPSDVMRKTTYDPQSINDDAFDRVNHTGPVMWPVDTRTVLKALDTTKYNVAYLKEGGREGVFEWATGDFSSHVTADTQEGVYIKSDGVLSTLGAWVRRYDGNLNIKWFGAQGVATDDTAAFLGAISLITAVSGDVFVPTGSYKISSTLIVPDGSVFFGEGRGYEFSHRTKLLFTGTGAKSYSMPGATATVVANPDVGAPYLGDSGTRGNNYSTLDLTVGFSAAIILGKASGLKGLGIYPNFDGVVGYAGTDGRLSDEWDVGVWARNSDWWSVKDCNVIGHWRKSALLVTAHDIGDSKVPSNELGHVSRCHFQGFRGVTIRTAEIVVGDNYGFAGTDFINCLIKSLWHQSRHLATSSFLTTPFSIPSACMEISGDIMRGIQFLNCTFMGRDDIAIFFGKNSEIKFDGCYEEGKSIMVSGAWLANSDGMRMVATADTQALDFGLNNSKYVVDFSPAQTRDASLTGKRYISASGAFNPAHHFDGDYSRRIFGSYIGYRMRKSTDSYRFENELGTEAVNITASGELRAKLHYSGTVTIADDAAASIPAPKNGGFIAITCCGTTENGNFPDALRSGIVFYDVGTAAFSATKISAAGANFIAVNTDVTGVTGTDGNVTVGVIDGNIRIENRAGSSQVFRYHFFG
jgi:hypothetical protein